MQCIRQSDVKGIDFLPHGSVQIVRIEDGSDRCMSHHDSEDISSHLTWHGGSAEGKLSNHTDKDK
ncbi:MAG: hypothetical protein J7J01_01445 [Methanophagales archaeon]|nr:hypothetical protein [Methanophagales archaeon]